MSIDVVSSSLRLDFIIESRLRRMWTIRIASFTVPTLARLNPEAAASWCNWLTGFIRAEWRPAGSKRWKRLDLPQRLILVVNR